MNRKIEIKTCQECPHRGHKGAFGRVSYVPVCRKADKTLPHSVEESHGHIHASPTHEIPEWCPLSVDIPKEDLELAEQTVKVQQRKLQRIKGALYAAHGWPDTFAEKESLIQAIKATTEDLG